MRRYVKSGWVFLRICLCALTLSTLASAETAAGAELDRERSLRFAEERLGVWQQRLKLDDWKISLVMQRRSEMKPRTTGGIRWDKGKKTAVIALLDISDYRAAFDQILDDLELTIVHELVHLGLASLPRSEASRSSEEHAVNRMAEALIALDRRK